MQASENYRGAVNYLAGLAAEDSVARDYETRGYQVLEQRWRSSSNEIDLIVTRNDELVFVEVKKSKSHDRAMLAFGMKQFRGILSAAAEFLASQPEGQRTKTRFDLATVDVTGEVAITKGLVPNV